MRLKTVCKVENFINNAIRVLLILLLLIYLYYCYSIFNLFWLCLGVKYKHLHKVLSFFFFSYSMVYVGIIYINKFYIFPFSGCVWIIFQVCFPLLRLTKLTRNYIYFNIIVILYYMLHMYVLCSMWVWVWVFICVCICVGQPK